MSAFPGAVPACDLEAEHPALVGPEQLRDLELTRVT